MRHFFRRNDSRNNKIFNKHMYTHYCHCKSRPSNWDFVKTCDCIFTSLFLFNFEILFDGDDINGSEFDNDNKDDEDVDDIDFNNNVDENIHIDNNLYNDIIISTQFLSRFIP